MADQMKLAEVAEEEFLFVVGHYVTKLWTICTRVKDGLWPHRTAAMFLLRSGSSGKRIRQSAQVSPLRCLNEKGKLFNLREHLLKFYIENSLGATRKNERMVSVTVCHLIQLVFDPVFPHGWRFLSKLFSCLLKQFTMREWRKTLDGCSRTISQRRFTRVG